MKKFIYDIEVYPNFFLLKFLDENKKMITISSESDYRTMLSKLKSVINEVLLIGFNNKGYDRYILEYLFRNYNKLDKETLCLKLKKLSDDIIHKDLFEVIYRDYKLNKVSSNDMDISDWVNRLSLKELGVRIHHRTLETLPIKPDTILNEDQKKVIEKYCENDIEITRKLLLEMFYNEWKAKEALVESLNLPKHYYSLTDRKIVENILCGEKAPRSPLNEEKKYSYKCPVDISFVSRELNDLKKTYEGNLYSDKTKFLKKIDLFGLENVFSKGGIHSSKKKYKGENLIDIDVVSYYPNIIKNYNLLPNNVKNPNDYYDLIDERIKNKKSNPKLALAQKVVLNSIYGALRYSFKNKEGVMYDYKKLITTTITGQLLIIKLIEMLYLEGYEVVYANTDGIMIVDKGDDGYLDVCRKWEKEFNYTLEYNKVKKIFIRDVNNYMLLNDKNEIKTIGCYNIKQGTNNAALHRIVWEAIKRYVFEGKDPRETIYESNDIRDFILYHKYSKQYEVFLFNYSDETKEKQNNVIRYALTYPNVSNSIVAIKDFDSYANRYETRNVFIVKDLNNVDINLINRERYLEITYDKLEDLLGYGIVINEKVVDEVEKLKVSLNAK